MKRKTLNRKLIARVDDDLYRAVQKAARKQGRSDGAIIRQALRAQLEVAGEETP